MHPDEALLVSFLAKRPALGITQPDLSRLAGDVSSRRYWRAHGREGATLILTVYPQPFDDGVGGAAHLRRRREAEPGVDLTWANDAVAHIEATELLASQGLPVPRILAVDGAAGVIAVQDLGDLRLQEVVQGGATRAWQRWYGEAVALIAAMQEVTPLCVGAGAISGSLALDAAKLHWELEFFARHCWRGWAAGRVGDSQIGEALAELKALCDAIGARPRVLCHRDYHARNLMVVGYNESSEDNAQARLWIIDHQDMRLGPATYDLVSLLEDPYVQPPAEMAEELWERWRLSRASADVGFEWERRAVTVQRLLKAAGTYAMQLGRGHGEFRPWLDTALRVAAQALRALGDYPAALRAVEATCPP